MNDARNCLVAASLALALAACAGGGQAPARAPAAPETTPQADAQPAAPAAASQAGAPAGAMAPPPPASQPAPAEAREEAPGSMAEQVGADLKRAEHDVAAGNCPTACRALGSMERAVVFLCAAGTSQSRDDGDRCDNAKHHLLSARHRVRTTCGGCPDGPSVEQDAPIPSTR